MELIKVLLGPARGHDFSFALDFLRLILGLPFFDLKAELVADLRLNELALLFFGLIDLLLVVNLVPKVLLL